MTRKRWHQVIIRILDAIVFYFVFEILIRESKKLVFREREILTTHQLNTS